MFEHLRRQQLNQILITVPEPHMDEIKTKLQSENIPFSIFDKQFVIYKSDVNKVDKIISEVVLPNLLPAQWHWLLAISGLEAAIDALLEALKTTDPEKYAMYKGFLNGARFYEFPKALAMLDQAKPVIETAYPELDLSIPTLKALWRQAAQF